MNEITHKINIPPSQIVVNIDTDKWLIKITKEGFKFNREEYPEAFANDFAQAFCDILEKQYIVTFEKRKTQE